MGVAYLQRGELHRAETYRKKALGNLGSLYARRGELDKAEEQQQKALAIHREIDDRLAEARDLCNLGLVYARRRHTSKARELLLQADKLFNELAPSEGRENVRRALQRLEPKD